MQRITVLFVEDDAGVRETLPLLLPDGEFKSLVAPDGYEALRILEREHIDVLITDVMMPGLTGVDVAKQALVMRPDLRVIFMTGYLSRAEEAEKIAPLLYKPVRMHEIEAAIRNVLA
jgi:DNA-binding NtrC family response regulator